MKKHRGRRATDQRRKPISRALQRLRRTTEAQPKKTQSARPSRARTGSDRGPLAERRSGRQAHQLQVHQIELEMQNEELRQAQLQAEESRNNYQGLYETISIACYTVDTRGTILSVNQAGATLLQTSPHLLLGRRIQVFLHEEDREAFNAFCKRALKGKGGESEALLLSESSGMTMIAVFIGSPSVLRSKVPTLRLAVMDIRQYVRVEGALRRANEELEATVRERTALLTAAIEAQKQELAERRRIESELSQSEERFRKIFHHAALGIAIGDFDGRFIQCNPAYLTLTGYSEEELRGMTFHSLIHLDDHERNMSFVRELTANVMPSFEFDCRYVHKSGKTVWVHKFVSMLRSEDGRSTHFIRLVTDVSERRKAEEMLRELNATLERRVRERAGELVEANERFQWVVKATTDGVWDWDLVHGTAYFSPRWKKMHGFLESDPLESADEWSARIHVEDRKRVLDNLQDYLERKRHEFWEEYRIRRKDETYIWVLDRGVAVWNEQGRAIRMVGAETDITWRKEAEEALRRREAQLLDLSAKLMQAQEEERRRIARELHDDFTQRLAALTLDLQSLRSSVPDRDSAFSSSIIALRKTVEGLATDLQRMAHQLHPSILEHAGLEAAVREQVDDFTSRTGLVAETHVRGVPQRIPLDRATCLYRVLQESLQNVRKHANANNILVHLLGTRQGLGLCVHDDGRGIEDMEGTARRKGLGLTSMEERVRLLKGSLRIRSKPGDGTEVHAWVPLEDVNRET